MSGSGLIQMVREMKEQNNEMRPNNPQSAIRNPQSVELRIDELVLDGFAPGDRYLIAEVVESELARLFAERGVPRGFAHDVKSARLDAGVFNVAQGSGAKIVGAQVAQAVFGSFKG
ncbi:MAG TPA: hypothetical protein VM943_12460 [Pyrinomonadaceae bacterium]|nr:hypothetical protein [Pyrinomonadaceae bacterium]